jgi:hypothetical protein
MLGTIRKGGLDLCCASSIGLLFSTSDEAHLAQATQSLKGHSRSLSALNSPFDLQCQ